MYINCGMSYSAIVRELNGRGIKTKGGFGWAVMSIKNVLTNCNYIGNVRYALQDDKRYFEVKGLHEPIIFEELYSEAQMKDIKLRSDYQTLKRFVDSLPDEIKQQTRTTPQKSHNQER